MTMKWFATLPLGYLDHPMNLTSSEFSTCILHV